MKYKLKNQITGDVIVASSIDQLIQAISRMSDINREQVMVKMQFMQDGNLKTLQHIDKERPFSVDFHDTTFLKQTISIEPTEDEPVIETPFLAEPPATYSFKIAMGKRLVQLEDINPAPDIISNYDFLVQSFKQAMAGIGFSAEDVALIQPDISELFDLMRECIELSELDEWEESDVDKWDSIIEKMKEYAEY